jgi:hypothetical protein
VVLDQPHSAAAQPKDNARDSRAENQVPSSSEWWSIINGVSVAVFTFALVIVGSLQWRAMRHTLNETRRSVDVLWANTQSLIAGERAWVFLESLEGISGVMHQHTTTVALRFKNHGRTPAWLSEVGVVFVLQKGEMGTLINSPKIQTVPYTRILVHGESTDKFTAHLDLRSWVEQEVMEQGWIPCVYGFVRYRDIFGQSRETSFCRSFHQSDGLRGEWKESGPPEANRNT